MMAKLHDKPFNDPKWIFEIKWDGYRAVADVAGKDTKLYSRNGLSFAAKYPDVFNELKKIKKKVVLDGEIVALDEKGMPNFQLLQQYGDHPEAELVYYVFDVLYVNGKTVENKPLLARKQLLRELLPPSNIIKYCDHIEGQGKAFFKLMKKQELEGMIAKRADSVYRENYRSDDWLKVKQVQTLEAIIAGYTEPRNSRKHFGALVLGMYKKGKFTYIGHTGTGFDDKTLRYLYEKMQALVVSQSPFKEKVPLNGKVTWLEPELVCNIKYGEETQAGILRQPVFMGLRVDKEATEISREKQNIESKKDVHTENSDMDKTKTVNGNKVALTHIDKVYWPEEGYTKGDMIEYYNKVYKYIGKYLKDRPESLRRTPNGITDEGFFHKDAGDAAPDWVDTYKMWSESANKEINYIVCNNKATLLYMANLGCIELNPWNSRVESVDNPDYLVIDIDPSEKNTFDQVVDTALMVKEIFDKCGCPAFCKTSGATGLHVYVPLGAKYSYEQARDFANTIAMVAQEQLADFTSLERSLSKRGKDKIYIDYLQNRPGQTLSCAYSLRPKPHAPVSTPLEWKEVKHGLKPSDFNIKNTMERLEKKGDLFTPVLGRGIDMMKALKKLGA
ncbi:MAG: DNA ligase D [Bacteroidetes bacterium]|nr:DNA ligase D [Bacteroidota bacterium]